MFRPAPPTEILTLPGVESYIISGLVGIPTISILDPPITVI